MAFYVEFIMRAALLGTGLAMDAFSVSVANGLSERQMSRKKMAAMAALFAGFQCAMPLIGWFCVHTLVEYFRFFEKLIPYIALILLLYIGGKMVYSYFKNRNLEEAEEHRTGHKDLFLQGIATSIDALSVGFTIEHYSFLQAVICAAIIGGITFVLCRIGVSLGRRFAAAFKKAELVGGIILIFIGLEIFIQSFF